MLYFNSTLNERVKLVSVIGFGIVRVRNKQGEIYNTFLNDLQSVQ